MGSAVVKQRTERQGNANSSSKLVNVSEAIPTEDKYEPLYHSEDNNKARSKISEPNKTVSLKREEKSSHPQQHQSRNDKHLNRKKKHLGQRFKMLKFFSNSDDELIDSASVMSSENSSYDHKKSMSQEGSGKKKATTSQTGLSQNGQRNCSQGDSHLSFVQRKHNPLLDKTISLFPKGGSQELEMLTNKSDKVAASSIEFARESNTGEDLDNKDVCRDARTPSPQFDELEHVTVMSFNQSTRHSNILSSEDDRTTPIKCLSADDKENVSEDLLCQRHLLNDCQMSNMEHTIKSWVTCHQTRTGKYHDDCEVSSLDEEHSHQTDQDAMSSPNASNAQINIPTVNHPVVENVLASGDDFVDSLDEKFVMRGSMSGHDTHEKAKAEPNVNHCNEHQDSPDGSSPDMLNAENRVSNPESPELDDVYGGQRNNSRTANYSNWPYTNGLSQEKIECIQRQVYQEGLAPIRSDGGVAFFVPVEESGMQPSSSNANFPTRLRLSRKSGLNYEERMILADVNRSQQLDKRKEFAVKQNRSTKNSSAAEDDYSQLDHYLESNCRCEMDDA